MDDLNRTHADSGDSLPEIIANLKRSISLRGDLSHVSVEKQLEILNDLSSFPLGQFFLARKGANGFWTDYIINYLNKAGKIGANYYEKPLSPTEKFILKKCPLTLATRERFSIFQNEIQKRLKEGVVLASIPCGVMRDLLTLDFSHISSFSLIGADLDPKSLLFAKELAKACSLEKVCNFLEEDAWKLKLEQSVDLLTSSGLNVYISDYQKVRNLYRNFHSLLRKGGILITSVLTYPPDSSTKSEWVLKHLPQENIKMEKILFQDILGLKWRNFRSSQEAYEDFRSAGFKKIEIIFDKYHIFPTVVAEK